MKNKYEIRGDVTVIYMNHKGKVVETIIDTEDLESIKEYTGTWCTRGGYAIQRYNNKNIPLHKVIMNYSPNEYVDHISRDRLDNRKSNLRLCSHAQNMQNLPIKSNNKSGKRGISWSNYHQKWSAEVTVNQKKHFIGYFNNIEDADIAVKDARSKLMPFSSDANYNTSDSTYFKDTTSKPLSNNKLGLAKNVGFDRSRNKYFVRFVRNKKSVFSKRYDSLEEAINAAEEARNKYGIV